MKPFRETDLPGIGRKFQLDLRSGDRLVIVIHDDGKRELYLFNPADPEECAAVVVLDDEEARQVSTIIGGVIYKPSALEDVEMKLDQLVIDWFKVEPAAKSAGKTIGEMKVRQETGATIIAIIEQNHTTHITPGPDRPIPAHSTIVLAGTRETLKACKRLIQHGGV